MLKERQRKNKKSVFDKIQFFLPCYGIYCERMTSASMNRFLIHRLFLCHSCLLSMMRVVLWGFQSWWMRFRPFRSRPIMIDPTTYFASTSLHPDWDKGGDEDNGCCSFIENITVWLMHDTWLMSSWNHWFCLQMTNSSVFWNERPNGTQKQLAKVWTSQSIPSATRYCWVPYTIIERS